MTDVAPEHFFTADCYIEDKISLQIQYDSSSFTLLRLSRQVIVSGVRSLLWIVMRLLPQGQLAFNEERHRR